MNIISSQTKFKLTSLSIGLIILIFGFLGFILLKNAQNKSLAKQNYIEALLSNTINATDKDTLKKSQKELADYINQIESVSQVKLPLLLCEECELQQRDMRLKLENINNKLKSIEDLESAMKLALAAAILIQKPPHSADIWRQAQSKYQESIKLLENINPQSVVFEQAQEKLTTYRKNLAYINNIYSLEQKAVADVQYSNKLVNEAKGYINNEPKKKLDLQEAESKLKQAVTILSKIPNGTTVTKSAKQQLVYVRNNYQDVSVKLNNFIDPTEFNNFTIRCDQIGSKFIDVELTHCFGYTAIVKNYSSDWYEVNYYYNEGKNLIELFDLIPPGGEKPVSLKFDSKEDVIKIRKLLSRPSKIVKISCNDKLINIWGVRINPKCNSDGTYIDLVADRTYKTIITLDNGNTIGFENTGV